MDQHDRVRRRAFARAALGVLVFAVASGVAHTAGVAGSEHFGLTGITAKAIPAVTLFMIAVPLVLSLRGKWDRRPVGEMGLRRPATAGYGFIVVGTSAGLVLGVGAAAGTLRVDSVDRWSLASFLLVNTVLALLLEAVPEELTLRGYTFSALADRWRPRLAGAGTTALFVIAPSIGIAVGAGLDLLIWGHAEPVTFAPGGQDPAAYAVLLAVFGAMLVTARIACGSVWVCVAAHLTFLTVNRIFIAPAGFDTGVDVHLAPGGSEVMVVGYLLGATVAFAVIGARSGRGRRTPNRDGNRRRQRTTRGRHRNSIRTMVHRHRTHPHCDP
ncbi:CPBP family intramembrane glutamic endopeptidase [Pseudonocardia spinosispora]|uniref:CPBP family intramembrane glutamic endopeptidase n=1 Tax=Pseudonocardia spinosispora TaxID=103441 RepID=UPI000684B054|nr:CPBP family intramembrane glutamic endopeptidase [Pseudonocardia spinosispora]